MTLKNKKIVWLVLGLLMAMNALAWLVILELGESGVLEVGFFDVGQGDAIFIETPDGFQVLIDGGPDLTVLEKLGKEMPFYDREIDLIILTHPEHDHLFGLLEVLKRYEIKNILWTGIIRDTAEWEEWKRLIGEEGAEIKIAQAGQPTTAIQITLSSTPSTPKIALIWSSYKAPISQLPRFRLTAAKARFSAIWPASR